MPQDDSADFRPGTRRAGGSSMAPVVVAVIVALAGAGWWYWSKQQAAVAPPVAVAPATAPSAPADAPAAPAPTGPQNLVDGLAEPEPALPPLAEADARVASALAELLGSKPVASFLQIDGFVRRFVATVDNLPNGQAPSRIWPVQASPQRFAVRGDGEAQTIDPDNASRYTPFVLFAESIDPARAAAVYARLYPLFQQAYEELGYPGRYFNDRLVGVIDHLLQAPEPAEPPRVTLTEVKGENGEPVVLTRPWVRYEFADPQLESLSSGQKMMVRVGLVNERRLKTKLRAFRAQVATGAVLKKPSSQ